MLCSTWLGFETRDSFWLTFDHCSAPSMNATSTNVTLGGFFSRSRAMIISLFNQGLGLLLRHLVWRVAIRRSRNGIGCRVKRRNIIPLLAKNDVLLNRSDRFPIKHWTVSKRITDIEKELCIKKWRYKQKIERFIRINRISRC